MKLLQIPIDLIDPPQSADRLTIDETKLLELRDSIADLGLIQPIEVIPRGARYEIVHGHRRYLASKMLASQTIDALMRDNDSEAVSAGRKFAENLHRANLSPIEEARALSLALEALNLDSAGLARFARRREAWVEGRLSLLDLPDDLGPLVHTRELPIGAALALARCSDAEHRAYLTSYAITSGASVHVIAQWVEVWKHQQLHNPGQAPPRPILPAAGERVTVQLPCYTCHVPNDHEQMVIARICRSCAEILARGEMATE